MSGARPIGEIIAPLLFEAIGIARLQDFLECIRQPSDRKQWIMEWYEGGTITADEAELLIEHNRLEAA